MQRRCTVFPMKCVPYRFEKVERTRFRNRILVEFFSSSAILLLFATAACAQQGAAANDLFKAKCAVCHGPDGSGNTAVGKSLKLRDLRSDEVQKQSDAKLAEITNCGEGKM